LECARPITTYVVKGKVMPPRTFALLIAAVIAAGGATIWLATWAQVPLAVLGILALVASLIIRLRRRDR
jgi:hypothetical protein